METYDGRERERYETSNSGENASKAFARES